MCFPCRKTRPYHPPPLFPPALPAPSPPAPGACSKSSAVPVSESAQSSERPRAQRLAAPAPAVSASAAPRVGRPRIPESPGGPLVLVQPSFLLSRGLKGNPEAFKGKPGLIAPEGPLVFFQEVLKDQCFPKNHPHEVPRDPLGRWVGCFGAMLGEGKLLPQVLQVPLLLWLDKFLNHI